MRFSLGVVQRNQGRPPVAGRHTWGGGGHTVGEGMWEVVSEEQTRWTSAPSVTVAVTVAVAVVLTVTVTGCGRGCDCGCG